MPKIRKSIIPAGDPRAELLRLVMRPHEKGIGKAQLIEQGNGRGMDRIPPKIAQEIGMLFKDERTDARPGEQKARHHTGRSSTNDAQVVAILVHAQA
jgi:hypothetical protein